MTAEDWSITYYPDKGEEGDARIVEFQWQLPPEEDVSEVEDALAVP